MHSDPKLVARIEDATETWHGLVPKKMFGGMAWLLNGNMCVGVWHDSLVVRCDPQDWPGHLKRKHVREMDITGRSMKGWLLVEPPGLSTASNLQRWLQTSRDFVSTLPSK
jgi:hypothetical protein